MITSQQNRKSVEKMAGITKDDTALLVDIWQNECLVQPQQKSQWTVPRFAVARNI